MKKIFLVGFMFLVGLVGFSQPVQLPKNSMPVLGNYHYVDSVRISKLMLDSNLQGVGQYLRIDTITGMIVRDTVSGGGGATLQTVTDNDSITDNAITIENNYLKIGYENDINSPFPFSLAVGAYDTIKGDYCLATGYAVEAKGDASTVHGYNSRSIGDISFSTGDGNLSWGNSSFTQGVANFARSWGEMTIGLNATDYVGYDTLSFTPTNRLFSIGNGVNQGNRNNALTMLKNGTTEIDTTWRYNPTKMLNFSFNNTQIPHAEWVRREADKIANEYQQDQTGWAQYRDGQYTNVSRFSIVEGDTVTLPNDAAQVLDSQLPSTVTTFYNATDTVIEAQREGDAYMVRINFMTSNDNISGNLTVILDIGGGVTFEPITQRTYSFPRGANTAHSYSTSTLIYSLGTFIANGAKIRVTSGTGDSEIWDISYVISRIHRGK